MALLGALSTRCDTSESNALSAYEPIVAPIAIDASNASRISKAIIIATRGVLSLSSLASPATLAASVTQTNNDNLARSTYAETQVAHDLACLLGGHVSVIANRQRPNRLSAHDSFATSFENCVQGSAISNGKVDFVVSEMAADERDAAILAASVVLTNFATNVGGEANAIPDRFQPERRYWQTLEDLGHER